MQYLGYFNVFLGARARSIVTSDALAGRNGAFGALKANWFTEIAIIVTILLSM